MPITSAMRQRINDLTSAYDGPIPVIDIANKLAIKVFMTDALHSDESGLIRKEGDDYVIYVNRSHPLTRQRFTIAHEIGHFIAHKDVLDAHKEFIDRSKSVFEPTPLMMHRDEMPKDADQLRKERTANTLAALLLMPERNFRQAWEKSPTVEGVAEHLKVSAAAATVRAKELYGYLAV